MLCTNDAVAADIPATANNGGLEEIIVTARRREENLQSVPIAVSVFSQQALQDNNVHSLGDLQTLVPSLSMNTAFTRDAVAVSIRGQGQNPSTGLPGVVMYLNEVPIPTGINGELAGGPGLLFDLENLQVLKGPQGTLFGRNSVGGDILLQTAQPTNTFGGHLQVGYGNYNNREVDAVLNLPISDILLTRLAVNGQVRDGFTRLLSDPNHPNGTDADNRDYYSVRETVIFRPDDRFQNDTIVTFTDYHSHGSPLILSAVNPTGLVAGFGFLPLFAQQQALGIRAAIPVNTPDASSGNYLALRNISRVSLTDDVTFRNIVGFDRSSTVVAIDADATVTPLIDSPSTPQPDTFRQYSDEAQLLGKGFGGRLDWVAGAFFLHQVGDPFLETQTVFFAPQDRIYGQASESKALFGQGTYDLSALVPALKFTGGVRYTWDESSLDQRGGNASISICVPPTVNCDVTSTVRAQSSALTWTAGLDYQVAPNSLLYLTSRKGYRPGGVNMPASVPQFAPEYITDVELGIKSDWHLGEIPLRTNADVYYQDYRDVQVEISFVGPAGISQVTQNASAARIAGAEFEAIAELTHDLQVGATFDYLNFRYTSFDASVSAATIATLEGSRTVNNPPRKYGVNARYHLPFPAEVGDISVRANWNWQATSGYEYVAVGGVIKSYGLLSATLNWDNIRGTPVDVSLFGSNLTDKVYTIGGVPLYNQVGYDVERFGEPRMYGIRLRYRFGGERR